MDKNILSEICRTHEIMGFYRILEQKKNFQIGKSVVSGNPAKGEPLHIVVDREAKYDVNDDNAESVGAPFFWTVINALERKFPWNEKTNPEGWGAHKDKIKLKKVTIRSGASNFYNGAATAADVMNDRVKTMSELSDEGGGVKTYNLPHYQDNEVVVKWDKSSKPYKDNLALARRRGENFLAWIKDNLKANGLLVLDPMEKEDVEAYVVDTGGVVDNKRDESAYPNPGQFITMDLELGAAGGMGEETTECLVDMKIFVSYIEGKSPSGHNCDAAIFKVLLNKVPVFIANLNNANDPDVGDSKKHRISAKGKNRVCGMTIGNKLAQKIMSKTNSETIEVGIEGMVEGGNSQQLKTGKPTTYQGERIPGNNPPLHADVPLVTLKWGDGKKWQGTPNVKLKRGDTSYAKIMSFDVCKQEVDA